MGKDKFCFCFCWKQPEKKIVRLILISILLINYSWAQTQEYYHNTSNPDRKVILPISSQQAQNYQNIPLQYDVNNFRIESAFSRIINSDTLIYGNTGYRWSTNYGTNNHYNEVYDIIEDYDKGYYMVGWDVISSGNGEGWNIKTNINGNLLYDKKLIHSGVRLGFAACQDSLGNKYIAGIDFSEINWPFLIKFNACGEKEWCTLYKDWGYMWGYPLDVIINEHGNILVLSRVESEEQINQIFLLCYNIDGDLLWSKPYASKNNHPLIAFASGEKLYKVGEDYIISGHCYYPYPDNPNHVWLRPMFIGVDSQFNEKWLLPFGVSDSLVGRAYSIIPISDSVMMGVGGKFLDYPIGNIRNSLMMFINHEGEELGYKRIWGDSIIPGTQDNLFIEVEPLNDSMFISSAVIGPEAAHNPFGEVVFDTSGHVYYAQIRPNTTGISSMVKTFDEKYVISCSIFENDMNHTDIYMYKINSSLEQDTLYTNSFVYDSLCPDSIVSGNIDMTDCFLQVEVEETQNPEENQVSLDAIPINVYPNPANSVLNIDIPLDFKTQSLIIELFDIKGSPVLKSEPISNSIRLNIKHLSKGLYLLKIQDEGSFSTKRIFIY